jgi:hypothetical protein
MGSLVVTLVVALVATWAATSSASAMTLEVETIELPHAGGNVRSFVHRLRLTGPLETGDSDTLRDTLKTLEQLGDDDGELATIELDSRGVYNELAAAGVALPSLQDKALHMKDVRLGPRSLECLASLSSHGEAYGVVLITSRGIAAPPNAAPPSCPELFLHAPDDLINLSSRP